jgi:hypothetical protein
MGADLRDIFQSADLWRTQFWQMLSYPIVPVVARSGWPKPDEDGSISSS